MVELINGGLPPNQINYGLETKVATERLQILHLLQLQEAVYQDRTVY